MSIGCCTTLSQARIEFDINCPIKLSKLVISSRYACPVVTKLRVLGKYFLKYCHHAYFHVDKSIPLNRQARQSVPEVQSRL